MKISVASSNQAWQSPDQKITIWDVIDSDNNKWSTMSGKIANAIGQTIEVTTRTNNKGKTYLVTPQPGGYQPPLAQSPGGNMNDATLARFEAAVAAFGDYVDRLIGSKAAPPSDVVPTEIPDKPMGYDFDRAIEALGGGEIVDDIGP